MKTDEIHQAVMSFVREAAELLVEESPIQDSLGEPVKEIPTPENGPRTSMEIALREIPVEADPPEARVFACQVWAHYAHGRVRLVGNVGYLPDYIGWQGELTSPDKHPGQVWNLIVEQKDGGDLTWAEAPLAA